MSAPWTRIEIGGKVSKAEYEELRTIAECNELLLTPQHPLILKWEDERGSDVLLRRVCLVCRFCVLHKLPYFVVYDTEGMDRLCEWWEPGTRFSKTSPVSYSDGEPVVAISDLLGCVDDHAALKELIARHTPPELPPFVIED